MFVSISLVLLVTLFYLLSSFYFPQSDNLCEQKLVLLFCIFTFIIDASSRWQFVWAKTMLLFSFCFCLFCLFSVLSFSTFIDASSRWQFVWVKSIPKCEPIAFICSSCHAIPHLLNHTSLIPWYWLNISRACKQDWRQPTIQFHWNCYRNCHHFW